MLVLKRKRRQRVVIGRDIILTIVGVSANAVRLGIQAPPAVNVVRGELLDQAGDVASQQDVLEPVRRRRGGRAEREA